jgi:N-[(2S)-2-amino-2-carboxyethyl]-L-glutamate dehydrogenase
MIENDTRPTANQGFHVVSGKTVHACVFEDAEGVIEAVRTAYRAHDAGATVNPDSYFLRFPARPADRIIALPAHLEAFDGGQVTGIKWISSFPGNIRHGIPRASAVLVLNDSRTGYPMACLEASVISAARTAASAVLGAFHLNGRVKSVPSLGIVGTGLIARYIAEFLFLTGWEVGDLHLHDLRPDDSAAFAARFQPRIKGTAYRHGSATDVLRSSDMAVFATTAGTPHVTDRESIAHSPVILHISLRDLSPEIILASHNVMDDVDHCMKADTSTHLAEKLVGHRRFVGFTLPSILSGGPIPERTRPIILSPFGMGILDLAVGRLVYERAVATGQATAIPDFFFEMTRI